VHHACRQSASSACGVARAYHNDHSPPLPRAHWDSRHTLPLNQETFWCVRRSVQRNAAAATREIASEDFFVVPNELAFPRMGRKTPPETPPHASGDFKWKDYCPVVRPPPSCSRPRLTRRVTSSGRTTARWCVLLPLARERPRLTRRVTSSGRTTARWCVLLPLARDPASRVG
jgi:hypothetical protein